MVKSIVAAFISVAFASNDVLSDDALSLLQMRAQKHQVQQPFTLSDGSVLEVRAGGSQCADDEVITFAKCVEAQKRQIIPNTMAHGTVYNSRGSGIFPIGCIIGGGNMHFNDEPGTAKGWPNLSPICQVGGGGGRAAEIIAQGISCLEPTCTQPAGHHKLIWDDSVFVPELKLGAPGGVCEEACELLTYEQCSKAGDMGLIEAISGLITEHQLNHQTFGPNHASGTMPSGCSANLSPGKAATYFNSMDTPSGIHAAPNTDGQPWVTPSGVGVGWSYVAPVCGVCTTTTTTPAPELPEVEDDAAAVDMPVEEDEAGAVGDPHFVTNTGNRFDYS